MKKSNEKKGYWVAKANVNSPEKQQNYGKLAEGVLEKFKGKFLIRGGRQVTKEGEEYMRNVVVEFPSYKDAIDAYESKEYQDALKVLDGGADRLYAVVEGYWIKSKTGNVLLSSSCMANGILYGFVFFKNER